jgi:hypothetical protein
MESVVNAVKGTIGIIPSPDDTNKLIRLAVQVQPYGYGKVGSNSLAARLAVATTENDFKIDESQPYGEVQGVVRVANGSYGWETTKMVLLDRL